MYSKPFYSFSFIFLIDIPCNLSVVIMENFENDLTYSIEDVGILDHLNVTLANDWLSPVSVDIPECAAGSVLTRAYCGRHIFLLSLTSQFK